MKDRINIQEVTPKAYQAMFALEGFLAWNRIAISTNLKPALESK
ncbi:hypothetical protein [Pedobacter sp. N36a]|nr:hypothetical protein [Pedobacter sp. N36a]